MLERKNLKVELIALVLMLVMIIGGLAIVEASKSINSATVAVGVKSNVEFGQLARTHVEKLSTDIGRRVAGTASEEDAAIWIADTMRSLDYETVIDKFSFTDGNQEKQSQNVVATKTGKGDSIIIVGAHYDSVVEGKGADDNASGVAVVMEAAKWLKDFKTTSTIKFVFFGAEENELDGSYHFANGMSELEISNTIVMVNLDSLIAGDFSYVYGDEGEKGKYRDWILEKAIDLELDIITQIENDMGFPPGTTGDWSDHTPFKELGIPYVYFESTNWNIGALDGYTQVEGKYGVNGEIWHTSHDNLEYLDKSFPGRIDSKLASYTEILVEFLINKF